MGKEKGEEQKDNLMKKNKKIDLGERKNKGRRKNENGEYPQTTNEAANRK